MRKFMGRWAKGPLIFAAAFLSIAAATIVLVPESVKAMELIRLKNGMNCVLDKRGGTGVVAVQVWVKVGSRYEDDRIAGITHFIEHLIFKGTEKGEGYEIAPKIEALGGSINAFTSYDNTVYHIVIPKDSFETGFELLVESVKSPAFPEKEIEKEKKVVIEEIKMGEDEPQRKLFKEVFAAAYPKHPYGRPIIGFEESVSGITRADILAYHRAHYTPDNMSVVVVGDFDEKRVRQLVEEEFSGVPAGAPVTKPKGSTSGTEGPRERIVEKNVAESYVTLSYPVGSFLNPDTPALEILARILSDGDSSRLQASLKHKQGLATDTDTYLFSPQEDGLFVVMATFKGGDYKPVIAGLDSELERLATEGPEAWELEKAKNLVRAQYIYSAETVQGKARQMGNFETLANDPEYAGKYVKAVDRVTAGDITRVMAVYLGDKGRRSTVCLLPKKAANPATIELPNGLRFVYNRNAASPTFSFMVGFVGGLKEEAKGENGSFNLLSRMLLKGTRDLDAQAIARRIDILAGGIYPISGKNVFGLSGKFLSKDFSESMALLKELLTATVIRDDELGKAKNEVLSEIRRRDDDPVQYTFTQMSGMLFEGHPYARDLIGSSKDVAALTVADMDRLYRSYVVPKGAVLAVSGDVEQKEAEKIVQRLFSDWKGEGRVLQKLPYMLPASKERLIEREMFQTHLIFSFTGPGLIDADRHPAEVMDAILSGMGGRLFKILREENPFAYAVTFFNQQAYEAGGMGIYIGTDPSHLKDVDRLVRQEIKRIRKDGFTEQEVADAKRYMIGSHYNRIQTNGAIASSMCLDTIYGLKPGFFKVWPGLVQKVTREEINAVAKKYLRLDRMVKIGVGPGPGEAKGGK